MKQPTVYLKIGGSAIAFEDKTNEILETVDWVDGKPDWTNAGICDSRGAGGQIGVNQLYLALTTAEENAKTVGYELTRVPYGWSLDD